MFCSKCGREASFDDRFCARCGAVLNNAEDSFEEIVYNPPVRAQKRPEPMPRFESVEEMAPAKPSRHIEMNWDLDGFSPRKPQKTETADFNWGTILDTRRKEKTLDEPISFGIPEEPKFFNNEDAVKTASQRLELGEVRKNAQELHTEFQAQSEPEVEKVPQFEDIMSIAKEIKSEPSISVEDLERELFGKVSEKPAKRTEEIQTTEESVAQSIEDEDYLEKTLIFTMKSKDEDNRFFTRIASRQSVEERKRTTGSFDWGTVNPDDLEPAEPVKEEPKEAPLEETVAPVKIEDATSEFVAIKDAEPEMPAAQVEITEAFGVAQAASVASVINSIIEDAVEKAPETEDEPKEVEAEEVPTEQPAEEPVEEVSVEQPSEAPVEEVPTEQPAEEAKAEEAPAQEPETSAEEPAAEPEKPVTSEEKFNTYNMKVNAFEELLNKIKPESAEDEEVVKKATAALDGLKEALNAAESEMKGEEVEKIPSNTKLRYSDIFPRDFVSDSTSQDDKIAWEEDTIEDDEWMAKIDAVFAEIERRVESRRRENGLVSDEPAETPETVEVAPEAPTAPETPEAEETSNDAETEEAPKCVVTGSFEEEDEEDDEDDEDERPRRKHTFLKIILAIIFIIAFLKVGTIALNKFAPNTAFVLTINSIFSEVDDLITRALVALHLGDLFNL